MSTHIHIGITQQQPGWEILLEQIGVDWSVLPGGMIPSPERYSAVIAVGDVPSDARRALYYYAEQGGALLDNTPGGIPRFVRTLFPSSSDPLFGHIPLIDLHGFIRSYGDRLGGTVALETKGNGHIARLGIDINRAITDTRKRRRLFYAPSGLFPNELVALVSKGALRMAVTTLLKELHFRRGLPFIHRRAFPGTSPNIFCFRIDSDGASREQVQTWCGIADKYDIPMSWYLHLEHFERWLDVFRDYPAQEIGIHSFVHKTYTTFEENSRNIQQARAILDAQGISYTGYAAPYGTWNGSVALAEEYHGFSYASEFSLAYDDVPFFPWLRNRFSPVLQIPIHPICFGSLGRIGMTEEEMNDYNSFVLHSKLCDGEPLVFYDHPLHPYTGALDAFFASVHELGIPALSFAQYADWWKRRLLTQPSVKWSDGTPVVLRRSAYDDVLLDIWHSHTDRSILRDGVAEQPSGPSVCRPELQRNIRDVRHLSRAVLRQTAIDTINRWRK